MVLALICLILFILALVFRGQPLKSIGWGKANMRAGLVTGLLMVGLVVFLRGKFGTILNGISAQEGQMLVIWLLLALAEETIFRGYIQLRLESYFGQKWGWLAAAALYLLWQMPGRLWITPLAEMWPTLLITLVQALLLGWVMRKSGHVLAPALYRAASGWLLLI
jgi:membrane protease YdiL (CAAX protease family)